jgi:hypothetical protein
VQPYHDTRDRLRFRGPAVQGTPEEPFLYISWRVKGEPAWVMRAKVLLTSLTEEGLASLPVGASMETEVSRFGHRDAGHVQRWRAV